VIVAFPALLLPLKLAFPALIVIAACPAVLVSVKFTAALKLPGTLPLTVIEALAAVLALAKLSAAPKKQEPPADGHVTVNEGALTELLTTPAPTTASVSEPRTLPPIPME
jgi:hypothetical protein